MYDSNFKSLRIIIVAATILLAVPTISLSAYFKPAEIVVRRPLLSSIATKACNFIQFIKTSVPSSALWGATGILTATTIFAAWKYWRYRRQNESLNAQLLTHARNIESITQQNTQLSGDIRRIRDQWEQANSRAARLGAEHYHGTRSASEYTQQSQAIGTAIIERRNRESEEHRQAELQNAQLQVQLNQERDAQIAQLRAQHAQQLEALRDEHAHDLADEAARHTQETENLDTRLQQLQAQLTQAQAEANTAHQQEIAQLRAQLSHDAEQARQQEIQQLQQRHEHALAEADAAHQRTMADLTEQHQQAINQLRQELAHLREQIGQNPTRTWLDSSNISRASTM